MFPRLRSLIGAFALLVSLLLAQPATAQSFQHSAKVAVNPAGTMFACYADYWTKIQVCAMDGKELFRLPADVHSGNNLVFTPAGDLLTDFDGYLTVWDTKSVTKKAIWKRSSLIPSSITCAPKGNQVMVLDGDWLYMLSLPRLEERSRWPIRNIMAVDWAPDGKSIAISRSAGTEIWKIGGRGGITKVSPVMSSDIRFSPDGAILAVGENGGVMLFDVKTGASVKLPHGDCTWVSALAWSPDGTRLAAAGGTDLSEAESIRVWDTVKKELITQLPGHKRSMDLLQFLPNGTLAAHDTRFVLDLWDIPSQKKIQIGTPPPSSENQNNTLTPNLNTGANSTNK